MLHTIEAYYDAVPRADAVVEQLGPFTLFVKSGPGWPYYARPSLGATQFTLEDVQRVLSVQHAFQVPQTFEWVADTTPSLAAILRSVGLKVTEHPLMVLFDRPSDVPRTPPGVEVRLVTESDDLALLNAVARVGFGAPGTAIGQAGVAAALEAVDRKTGSVDAQRERLRSGGTFMAAAFVDGQPVGVGSHNPVGDVTEIVGVAVLPAFRRRGIAAALTSLLVADSLGRGIQTVFLSADDHAVGRVYTRLGFREIATACVAEAHSQV